MTADEVPTCLKQSLEAIRRLVEAGAMVNLKKSVICGCINVLAERESLKVVLMKVEEKELGH